MKLSQHRTVSSIDAVALGCTSYAGLDVWLIEHSNNNGNFHNVIKTGAGQFSSFKDTLEVVLYQ